MGVELGSCVGEGSGVDDGVGDGEGEADGSAEGLGPDSIGVGVGDSKVALSVDSCA